jgi:hypothetical protein
MKKEKLLEAEEKKLDKQIEEMEEIDYGLKELIQGILIGLVMGFVLAWLLIK